MNITFFEENNVEETEIRKALKGNKLKFSNEPLSKSNFKIAKDSEVVVIFINSTVDKAILKLLPKLKLIVTRSTGFDHIDLKECKKKKILVSNIPTYGENTVAEHAFALLLDLSRNIHKSFMRISENNFSIEGLKGFDLRGKTIGVVGVGNIGEHVIRIAKGFEMNVLAFDMKKSLKLQRKLKFKYVSLENLLKNSDIVTLHVPLNKKTKHLINKKTIKLMKPNSILINTSRGEIVDTDSLFLALEKEKIRGAGLDVIEGEKMIKEEKELLHLSNEHHYKKLKEAIDCYTILHNEKVIFTPHIAFYSSEALQRIRETTIENIKSFIENNPKNLVK